MFKYTGQGKKQNTYITKIKDESMGITTKLTQIKRIIKECYKKLCAYKLYKLNEMDKLLEDTKYEN